MQTAAPSPVLAISVPDPLLERDAFVDRRWAIWRASAPLFERLGFRAVTFEHLAIASGMAPITMYRFFPNKQAVALFPLSHASGLGRAWATRVAGLPADPGTRTAAMTEFAAEHADAWRRAAELATEIGAIPGLERAASRAMKEAREVFSAIVRSVDPGMTPARFGVLYASLTSAFGPEQPAMARAATAGAATTPAAAQSTPARAALMREPSASKPTFGIGIRGLTTSWPLRSYAAR